MRLEITRTSELALRAFRVIAAADPRITGPRLAQTIEVSTAFLSHIVPPLVRAGWVDSKPGPDGGYRLRVPAGSVSVLAVIEAVEGPLDRERCVLRRSPCGGQTACSLHAAWTEAREAMLAAFDAVPVVADA